VDSRIKIIFKKLFAFTAESQRTQSKAIFFVGRRSREFYGGDTDKQKTFSSAGKIFRRRPEPYRESASPDSLWNWGQPLTGDEDKHMNEEFNEKRERWFKNNVTPLAHFKESNLNPPCPLPALAKSINPRSKSVPMS